MTPDDVRAAAERLVDFHERFAPLFGKDQAQDHAYDYLKGLMVCPDRKSIEPIALLVGHGDVSGLQKFVGAAPWESDDVMAEAQALFTEELAPSDSSDCPNAHWAFCWAFRVCASWATSPCWASLVRRCSS